MTYRTVNPATGETVRTFGEISDADLDSALEVARSCYQDDWRHRPVDLLLEQIRIAKDGGAEVGLGGDRINRPGYYLQPTILTGISEKNPASVLEFFGPVASFYVVDTEEEAIEIPFGAIKNSGFGRELAELGFGEFVNRKLVNAAPAGSPPWGPVPVS